MFHAREKQLRVPTRDEVLPGRAEAMRVPERHFVNGHPLRAPVSRRHGGRGLRHGLLLGRGAEVLGAAGRVHDRGRLRRRPHAEPDLRGGVLGRTGHTEVGARRLRPEGRPLRGPAARLLGEPRPDAGHAAGQRRRHPVPLGESTSTATPQRRAAEASRDAYQARADATPGTATSRPRSPRRRSSTTPRKYHQQYLAKNPGGYCGLGGTGVACPTGVGEHAG